MRPEERLLATCLVPDALLRRVIRAGVRNLAAGLDRSTPQEHANREAALLAEAAAEEATLELTTARAVRKPGFRPAA